MRCAHLRAAQQHVQRVRVVCCSDEKHRDAGSLSLLARPAPGATAAALLFGRGCERCAVARRLGVAVRTTALRLTLGAHAPSCAVSSKPLASFLDAFVETEEEEERGQGDLGGAVDEAAAADPALQARPLSLASTLRLSHARPRAVEVRARGGGGRAQRGQEHADQRARGPPGALLTRLEIWHDGGLSHQERLNNRRHFAPERALCCRRMPRIRGACDACLSRPACGIRLSQPSGTIRSRAVLAPQLGPNTQQHPPSTYQTTQCTPGGARSFTH